MQMIAPLYFTLLAALIFVIGVAGIFINRKNLIAMLMSIELMLLAVNLNFVTMASMHEGGVRAAGQIFVIFIMTVAAAEVAIGLAILVTFFRNRGSIATEDIQQLKG